MTPRRAVAEGPGVLAALTGALQNPSALVVGAALATLNNLLLVRLLGWRCVYLYRHLGGGHLASCLTLRQTVSGHGHAAVATLDNLLLVRLIGHAVSARYNMQGHDPAS